MKRSKYIILILFTILLNSAIFSDNSIEIETSYSNNNLNVKINPGPSGIHNELYLFKNNKLVDLLLLNCNTICLDKQEINYRLNESGNYFLYLYNFNKNSYNVFEIFIQEYKTGIKLVANELIVKFKQDIEVEEAGFLSRTILRKPKISTNRDSINELNKEFNIEEQNRIFKSDELKNIYKFRSKDIAIERLVKAYNEDPIVEYAEPNYIFDLALIPNDTNYNLQQAYFNITSAEKGWDLETGDSNVVIAIIDSGVDYNHSDLILNFWNNSDEITNNGIDDDNNGYVDDIIGYDFVDTSSSKCVDVDCTIQDNNVSDYLGHGTNVAGIAAAVTNNSKGIAGICWNCSLMIVRASWKNDEGGGNLNIDNVAEAIEYATNNSANIISMSFASTANSSLIRDTINYAYSKNVVIIAAAGNYNTNNDTYYPAGYENVTGVGSTDNNDQKASFSNYGNWVDVMAPGTNIFTTDLDNKYTTVSGTSISTPYVTGLAGLILSKFNLTNDQTRAILINSSDKISDLINYSVSQGRINIFNALNNNATSEPSNLSNKFLFATKVGTNSSLIFINETIVQFVKWASNSNLSYYVFSSNYTNSWTNDSYILFNNNWSNISKTLTNITGNYGWMTYANNTDNVTNNTGIQIITVLAIPNITTIYYDGNTTNFSDPSFNPNGEPDVVLEKTGAGIIRFNESIMFTQDRNLDLYINISSNNISIDTETMPEFNVSANITFYNLNLTNPRILRDGIECSSNICAILENNINLTFSVTHFTEYSAEEVATTTTTAEEDWSSSDTGGTSDTTSSGSTSQDNTTTIDNATTTAETTVSTAETTVSTTTSTSATTVIQEAKKEVNIKSRIILVAIILLILGILSFVVYTRKRKII